MRLGIRACAPRGVRFDVFPFFNHRSDGRALGWLEEQGPLVVEVGLGRSPTAEDPVVLGQDAVGCIMGCCWESWNERNPSGSY